MNLEPEWEERERGGVAVIDSNGGLTCVIQNGVYVNDTMWPELTLVVVT